MTSTVPFPWDSLWLLLFIILPLMGIYGLVGGIEWLRKTCIWILGMLLVGVIILLVTDTTLNNPGIILIAIALLVVMGIFKLIAAFFRWTSHSSWAVPHPRDYNTWLDDQGYRFQWDRTEQEKRFWYREYLSEYPEGTKIWDAHDDSPYHPDKKTRLKNREALAKIGYKWKNRHRR